MPKKASANMWWIIIGAVIALVVMIILMVMFTDQTNTLEGGLSACDSKGGICVSSIKIGPTAVNNCPANTFRTDAFDCGTDQDCCIGAPKKCDNLNPCGKGEECVLAIGGYCR